MKQSKTVRKYRVMRKQPQSARSKASDTQERLVARETFQYVTTNPKKYGAVSTRNERQLANKMNSLHVQQNKRLAKLSSQIYEVKVHQWKLKEVDETSRDPRTVEEKFLAPQTKNADDIQETELKHRATVETRSRVGKHSNSRNEEGLSISLRRNRPTTSGDISAKTRKVAVTSIKGSNGRILKHDRVHDYDLKQTSAEDLFKPIFEPLKQGGSVIYRLKDVPVRRDANVSKSYKYKSYNLMTENYLRERPKTPREITKYIKKPRNGLGATIDLRENLSVNKNHIGKINTRPDLRPRSVHVTNKFEEDTISYGHKIHAAQQNDGPTIKNHTNKEPGRIHYHEGRAGIYEESADFDDETEDREKRPTEVEENWAETLKSCRYLRKPRGYETPEISIESIFQND